ncbi:MAG: HEAT repeat domain-containing protein [Leptospiraceae bacterium]|nr:HEAT repeat domain-containing protein [Leptospiraceae bacterium]
MNVKAIILILGLSFFSLSAEEEKFLVTPVHNTSIEILSDTYENYFAKSLEDVESTDDDLDIDDITANSGINAKNNPKFPKKTNSTYKPNIPANNSQYIAPSYEEMDSEKQKVLTKEGLKAIEIQESKNNKSSVKQIARILLTNPIPEVRSEAARALGRMGRGTKALHRAIDTDAYEVRQHAYKALEKIGSRTSLKYFIKGTKSSDVDIKIASFKGLGKTRSSLGRDMIIRVGLNSRDPNVVAAALDGLGNFSRKDDLETLRRFLKSDVQEHQSGAVRGLGNSKIPESLDILSSAISENPGLEPEVIFAISKKKTLNATLLLMKMMQTNKNENYQAIIQRELNLRKAYGKYAIVKTNSATIRKLPRASSEKVLVLANTDVAKIRKVTEKRFKVKMNNTVIEDRYYLLQAIANKEGSKKSIVEGWVFGAKINVVNIANPAKKAGGEDEYNDEDSEDEKDVNKENNFPEPKKNVKPAPVKKNAKDGDYYEEDEDEDD